MKFKAFLISCFFLSSITNTASVKTEKADSIKVLLTVAAKKPDTASINKINRLAADYFKINPDSSKVYAERCIDLSRSIHYQAGVANGLVLAGHVSYFEGKPDDAAKNFDEAIAIYRRLNDKVGLTNTYIAYGRMYNLFANYKKAMAYLNKALQVNKQTRNELTLTDAYKNIGIVYFSEGKLSKALDFYYQALFIAVKNHYQTLSADLYNDIGAVLQNMEIFPNALTYFTEAEKIYAQLKNVQSLAVVNENVGEILLAQGRYNEAITRLNNAISMAKKQDDKDGQSSVYTDLGLCYAHKDEMQKALACLDTSLDVSQKYKIAYNQAYALIGFATVYNMMHDYRKALIYANKGQELAVKLGNLAIRSNAALQLSNTLAGLKRYEEAYTYLSRFNVLKKLLKDNEIIERSASYNYELNFAASETKAKEQRLLYEQTARNQHFLNLIFVLIISGMVIIAGIYYRGKRKQQKINAVLEVRNQEVLSQKTSLDEQAGKLHELNALKDRLISILAHDLRAPLSTLRGLFSLLMDESLTLDELLQMIPDVLKRLEYTSDFLDTLLFWINSQMENFEHTVRVFAVRDTLMREMEHYTEQAAAKGIELINNIPDDITAKADPNSVRIVLRNLVTNAIKFSSEHDHITISASIENDDMVLIKVEDTGSGMTEERQNMLFKSKVDSRVGTQNESGTGMGLLFCKDLVEKCNGTIWVKSREGAGTTFCFTVPANATELVS